ncbi:hypothetical protein GCM10027416_23150 [Okibacterium endophyticum]
MRSRAVTWRSPTRPRCASFVVDRRDVGGQEGFERLDVAVLERGEEPVGEFGSFAAVSLEARAPGIDVRRARERSWRHALSDRPTIVAIWA